MSDLMRNAVKEANAVRDKLKAKGDSFLRSREVSQQGFAAMLLSLLIRVPNIKGQFISTDYKDERTHMRKSGGA